MGSKRSRDSTRASPARSALPTPHSNRSDSDNTQRREQIQDQAARSDIPVQAREVIERERRRLQQASAVLSCLHIAAMYEEWHEDIDAGDIALIVRGLINEAVARLDLTELVRSAEHARERAASASADAAID